MFISPSIYLSIYLSLSIGPSIYSLIRFIYIYIYIYISLNRKRERERELSKVYYLRISLHDPSYFSPCLKSVLCEERTQQDLNWSSRLWALLYTLHCDLHTPSTFYDTYPLYPAMLSFLRMERSLFCSTTSSRRAWWREWKLGSRFLIYQNDRRWYMCKYWL